MKPILGLLLVCLAISARQTVSDGPDASLDNPLMLLKTLANLPPAQQELLLLVVGSSLQTKTGMDCNIFAGAASCKRLPADSSYLQQCPGVDPKIDCAFAAKVRENIYDSPVDEMYNYLAIEEHLDIKHSCPQCFDNVQAMWCALAAPKCGSFKTYVQLALLPILTDVSEILSSITSLESGYTEQVSESLSGVSHAVLGAMAYTMPCREMCVAAVETCDCAGRNETLGSLMEWMAAQEQPLPGAVSHALNKMLFSRVWDRPFCDMFLPYATPKFAGKCVQMASACQDRAAWCQATGPGKADAFRHIQAALMVQLTKAVTGWLSDAQSGLWGTHDALTKPGSDAELDALKDKYMNHHTEGADTASGPSQQGTPPAVIAIASICGVSVMVGVVGTILWQWVKLKRAERGYVELQQSDNFGVLDALQPSP